MKRQKPNMKKPGMILPVLLLFLCLSACSNKLTEIYFPPSFTAFTGYTAEETALLWQNTDDAKHRYTHFEVSGEGAVTLFVTPSQRNHNIRLFSEGLDGWIAQCANRGVDIICSDDLRHMTCHADSKEAYDSAMGELRAAQVSLSCLQLAKATNGAPWHLEIEIHVGSRSDEEIICYSLPDDPG